MGIAISDLSNTKAALFFGRQTADITRLMDSITWMAVNTCNEESAFLLHL